MLPGAPGLVRTTCLLHQLFALRRKSGGRWSFLPTALPLFCSLLLKINLVVFLFLSFTQHSDYFFFLYICKELECERVYVLPLIVGMKYKLLQDSLLLLCKKASLPASANDFPRCSKLIPTNK